MTGGYFNIGANNLKEIPIAFNKSVATLIINEVMRLETFRPDKNNSYEA